ncbi:hypothetical protein WJX74_000043 [Apatococcus lobatus]|uniref:Uncharacterized protein n=1 Tax=Apatococcus lobatus TaxID=904363 RepID=A0AAW1Q8Q3_9CHLO
MCPPPARRWRGRGKAKLAAEAAAAAAAQVPENMGKEGAEEAFCRPRPAARLKEVWSLQELAIGAEIGRGRTGHVYEGCINRERVAVKVGDYAASKRSLADLQHEAAVYEHLHGEQGVSVPRFPQGGTSAEACAAYGQDVARHPAKPVLVRLSAAMGVEIVDSPACSARHQIGQSSISKTTACVLNNLQTALQNQGRDHWGVTLEPSVAADAGSADFKAP